MVYILISMFTILVSFYLFNKVSGTMRLTELNVISFNYYYQLIIQTFIGTNIVILGLDNHYLLNRVTSFSIKQEVYLSVVFVLIIMPLSMLFISLVLRFNAKQEWFTYTKKTVGNVLTKDDKAVFITLLIFSTISVLSIIYTFYSIGTIPLLEIIRGIDSNDSARLRILASREFGGIVYVRNIFGLTLTPILSYISYSYVKKSKYIGWKLIFGVLFLMSILILTYSGAKAPVLLYILSFIFIQVIINGKISKKTFARIIIFLSLLIVLLYIFIMNFEASYLDINSGPLGRILFGQVMGLYFHFMYIPDVLPYLKLDGFPSIISTLYDVDAIRSSRIIMEIINPRGVDSGIAGVMNTLFVAEIYAAYGWLGIVFGTVYIGCYLQVIYILFVRLPKNPITISLFTYLTYSLPITGGFFEFIYNPGLVIVVLLLFLFYFIANIINRLFIKI